MNHQERCLLLNIAMDCVDLKRQGRLSKFELGQLELCKMLLKPKIMKCYVCGAETDDMETDYIRGFLEGYPELAMRVTGKEGMLSSDGKALCMKCLRNAL